MTNTFPIAQKKQEMLDAGKSQKESDEWETLVREITQVIASKQLVPTVCNVFHVIRKCLAHFITRSQMRTQCMRTAFQIPFDATVRVSLDTNLCMISERGYDLQDMSVWHRDTDWVLDATELHRFPHAVLEIKLEMGGGSMIPPSWVTELQNSGMLYECHKYSKFVHGCAVMLSDDIRFVPYWYDATCVPYRPYLTRLSLVLHRIDDISLRDAILESGGQRVLSDAGVGPGANNVYSHLLPFGTMQNDRSDTAIGRTSADRNASQGLVGQKAPLLTSRSNHGIHFYDDGLADASDDDEEEGCCGSWLFPFCSNGNYELLAPTSVQKIEPKVFFANERTFLHWLHHGVILSTIATGILSFSEETGTTWGEFYALLLLVLSLFYCIYALYTFLWRADRIKTRIPGRWDDNVGPILLGGALALVLATNFAIKIYTIATTEQEL